MGDNSLRNWTILKNKKALRPPFLVSYRSQNSTPNIFIIYSKQKGVKQRQVEKLPSNNSQAQVLVLPRGGEYRFTPLIKKVL